MLRTRPGLGGEDCHPSDLTGHVDTGDGSGVYH